MLAEFAAVLCVIVHDTMATFDSGTKLTAGRLWVSAPLYAWEPGGACEVCQNLSGVMHAVSWPFMESFMMWPCTACSST